MMSPKTPQDEHKSSVAPSIKPVSLSLNSSNIKKSGFNLSNSSRQISTSNRTSALPRRPHNLHHHGDFDASGDEEEQPAFESVTGFDTLTGKTISDDAAPEKKPLTIPVASGNNWRDRPGVIRTPKGKNLLPKEVQAMREAQRKGVDPTNGTESVRPNMSYGLSFAQDVTEEGNVAEEGNQAMEETPAPAATVEDEPKPLTEDELALRALVRESKGEVEGRSDLVIESRRDGDNYHDGPQNETKSFRADVAARPESASLDKYNAIPVEEFGAALLRGMGWKEGQTVGKGKYGGADPARANTPHVPARRPGFLGIGAKDVSGKGAEVELGAWGKSAMRKGSRKAGEEKDGERNTDGIYMPVLMRNKKTGETITAEELTALQKEAKKRDADEDWKERRDRNLERNGRGKDHERDRDRDRRSRRLEYEKDKDSGRYESRGNGPSRRDRSRSTSDRDSLRRRYEDDDRYYRERDLDRDRTRDRQRRSDLGRDRERDRDGDRKSSRYYNDDHHSSRHSSSNTSSRHRDRDRDSDRDSHRRQKHDDR
ncbi:DExH-box splicing factor binding site-domain-containing protein [Aspergillus pseudoustus]|uniref:Pre-mRNA-splicing factor n=1 Tax=Aspergillus pseudoustus TaxID=1810923 RepID=A0ABR4KKR9_9EURO